MDPRLNPYAPGAGSPPPELAGRDEIIERASVALAKALLLFGCELWKLFNDFLEAHFCILTHLGVQARRASGHLSPAKKRVLRPKAPGVSQQILTRDDVQ
jgi:hypothetical protein